MKVSERLNVLKRICKELEDRYNFNEAYTYIKAFVPKYRVDFSDFRDVEELAYFAFSELQDSVLGEIVDDLGIESLVKIAAKVQPPAIWANESKLRVFVSHLSIEKQKATRLRDSLAPYGMSAFVAHEDIEPTLEWQVQIERALHSMELFISMHTEGFKTSIWAQQEVGFAVATGVKIIALRMGEDPTGFISKHQALSRGTRKAEAIAAEIDGLLEKDQRLNSRYISCKLEATDDLDF